MINFGLLQAIVDAGATGAVVLAAVRAMQADHALTVKPAHTNPAPGAYSSLPAGESGPSVTLGCPGAVVLVPNIVPDIVPNVPDIDVRKTYERERKRAQRAAKSTLRVVPDIVPNVPDMSPSDQSTKKIDQIIINDLSVDAREAPQVAIVAEQVTRLCGGKRPGNLDEEIARHLAAGVPPETILATVRVVNQRKRGPPPASARYYAKEIMRAHAQRELPFPAASGVSDFAARWAANTAKQLAEREVMELRSG